jgi:hypothetical protein
MVVFLDVLVAGGLEDPPLPRGPGAELAHRSVMCWSRPAW